MKTLEELAETDEPAIDLIHEWVSSAENQCEILPPSSERESVLLDVQVTTRSTMGAVAYETGDDGDWQFLCGTTNDTEDGRLVSLKNMVENHPSVASLAWY